MPHPGDAFTVNAPHIERRLAAILSADVKEYSRLMGDDDVATVETLTAHREAMTTLITRHRGRVVDSAGDSLLAEFSSVVSAVQCSVRIQRELTARNAELPPGRRMEVRIGVNLGDVLIEGDRIYGDGINVAARVQGLAEGGGVCISG
jgi:adenylate cyclase